MTVELLAPAKVNLGLEVIRKRDDGYHEIATVFQTVSVFDRLRIGRSHADSVVITNRIEQINENLVQRAFEAARETGIATGHWQIEIDKRIPLSAGLGGASADAAATLLAIAEADAAKMAEAALALGSDVPFLLKGGTALARGRGELLDPLPGLSSCWFVLGTPALELERKTARLYGALDARDFSDGGRIACVADALHAGRIPRFDDLANTFSRPLIRLLPEMELVPHAFRAAGASFAALTGAGPTHYTIVPQLNEAISIARKLAMNPPLTMRVLIARPASTGTLMKQKPMVPGKAL